MPAPYLRYVSYGPEARLALRAAIEAAKAGDRLAPVTVAVPSNYAGLSLRRDLAVAREGGHIPGLLNVRFMVLARVAELAGAPRLAAQGRRPLTTPFRMEAVRAVLLRDPGPFAGVDEGAAERSLDRTFRDLDRCTDADLAALEAESERAGHVVSLYRAFRHQTREYYDDRDLAEAGAKAVHAGDSALTDIGHVIGYLLPAPTPAERAFLDALAEHGRLAVLAALTGDRSVDEATQRAWGDAAGGVEAPAPEIPLGTGVVLVNDAEEEVREAIREVAARTEHGLSLHRVAFLYRHASPYALIAAEQLRAAELPWNGPATQRLAQTAAGRTLLGFLALPRHDYRREDVRTWLTSAPVRREAGGGLVDGHRWDALAREAGVIGGREQWRKRLGLERDRLSTELDEMRSGDSDRATEARIVGLERRIQDLDALRNFLDELFGLDPPPEGAPWVDFAAWARGVLDRYVGRGPLGAPEEELEAHRAIEEVIEELGSLDGFETPASQEAFTQAVERALDRPAKRVGRFGHGMFLGRLSDAAGTDFDLVVVLGMNEGAIPAAGREDPLLPDAERRPVDGLGRRPSRMAEERRDYLAALASGRERLLFVARADLRGQRARLASRWLLETASARAGRHVAASQLESCAGESWFRSVPSFEAALDGAAEVSSLQERDLRELARWRAAGLQLPAHPLVAATRPLAAGFEAQWARRRREFGRWNGYVPAAAARSPFALEASPLSATALQGYAACPFSYYLGRVLRVAGYEVPEDELSISPLTRGSLVHEVLEAFIRAVPPRTTPAQPWSPDERARLIEIAEEACRAYEERGVTGRALLWQTDRERILADFERFLDEDEALRLEFGVVPVEPELAFGMGGGPDASIEVAPGRTLRLRGMIDRLDRSLDGGKLVVLDYKTGSANYGYPEITNDAVVRGTKIQLPLYAAAALQREDSGQAVEVQSYYWFITEGADFKRIGYEVDEPRRERFRAVLATIGENIEGGVFPARPGSWGRDDYENCKFCDYKTVCPVDKAAAWDRIRDDGRLHSFVDLAEPGDGA